MLRLPLSRPLLRGERDADRPDLADTRRQENPAIRCSTDNRVTDNRAAEQSSVVASEVSGRVSRIW